MIIRSVYQFFLHKFAWDRSIEPMWLPRRNDFGTYFMHRNTKASAYYFLLTSFIAECGPLNREIPLSFFGTPPWIYNIKLLTANFITVVDNWPSTEANEWITDARKCYFYVREIETLGYIRLVNSVYLNDRYTFVHLFIYAFRSANLHSFHFLFQPVLHKISDFSIDHLLPTLTTVHVTHTSHPACDCVRKFRYGDILCDMRVPTLAVKRYSVTNTPSGRGWKSKREFLANLCLAPMTRTLFTLVFLGILSFESRICLVNER